MRRQSANIALGLIILLGGAVRVAIARDAPIWRDEAQTIAIAQRSLPSGILEGLLHDGNAPLYYFFEHVAVAPREARDRELRDRLPALLFGVLLIPLGYFAARKISSPSAGAEAAGLCAAALLASSPVAVDLATQARGYSALAACSALCALAVALVSQ